jgi:hypothetical protein
MGEPAPPPPEPPAESAYALPAADSAQTNEWQRRVLLGTSGWMPRILATLATFAAPLQQCVTGDPSAIKVEWIDDSGAGRHLGSVKHYVNHFGIDKDTIKSAAYPPSQKVWFYTGGGDGKKASLALATKSDLWGECEQHLLDDCPEARSSYFLVDTLQRPRIHWPGSLPFYIKDASKAKLVCPEWNKIYADRVDENVPIFSDTITLGDSVNALPAAPADEEGAAAPDAEPEVAVPADGQGSEVAAEPPPQPVAERESRSERLRREATSAKHLMTHYPKNPYCQWCQRGRMCSARSRRKAADPDILPEQEPPTRFGQELAD